MDVPLVFTVIPDVVLTNIESVPLASVTLYVVPVPLDEATEMPVTLLIFTNDDAQVFLLVIMSAIVATRGVMVIAPLTWVTFACGTLINSRSPLYNVNFPPSLGLISNTASNGYTGEPITE